MGSLRVWVRALGIVQWEHPWLAQERDVEVADGSTVRDLLLTFRLPEAGVVAVVNGQVADLQQTLVEGDRVLLVPPVSGGSGAVRKM